MTETWLPDWEVRPGRSSKQGYGDINSRTLSDITGEVKHSMEGPLEAGFSVLDGTRLSSWTFSVPKNKLPNGKLGYQHYPLEAITWHAGDKTANIHYVGVEHEGVAGEPLTQHQVQATIDLTWRLRQLTAAGTQAPELRVNLWEHNWISATACPSGRIPWNAIITGLVAKEEPVAGEKRFIKKADSAAVYISDGLTKRGITAMGYLKEYAKVWDIPETVHIVSEHVFARIPEVTDNSGVDKAITDAGGKFRQWCMEAVDKFVRGDVGADQRIAREKAVLDAIQLSLQQLLQKLGQITEADAKAIADELAERLKE